MKYKKNDKVKVSCQVLIRIDKGKSETKILRDEPGTIVKTKMSGKEEHYYVKTKYDTHYVHSKYLKAK